MDRRRALPVRLALLVTPALILGLVGCSSGSDRPDASTTPGMSAARPDADADLRAAITRTETLPATTFEQGVGSEDALAVSTVGRRLASGDWDVTTQSVTRRGVVTSRSRKVGKTVWIQAPGAPCWVTMPEPEKGQPKIDNTPGAHLALPDLRAVGWADDTTRTDLHATLGVAATLALIPGPLGGKLQSALSLDSANVRIPVEARLGESGVASISLRGEQVIDGVADSTPITGELRKALIPLLVTVEFAETAGTPIKAPKKIGRTDEGSARIDCS